MRCILAVSGTLQEGFPLRKNLDAPGAPAVHLGSGLVRGVRSYLDVKERGCREFGNAPNPACVVTGRESDGNVYELYLVDGAACLGALRNGSLGAYAFSYKRDEFPARNFPARRDVGFVAQRVEEAFPSLVYDDADGSDGALGKAVGLAAGAVALGAAFLPIVPDSTAARSGYDV